MFCSACGCRHDGRLGKRRCFIKRNTEVRGLGLLCYEKTLYCYKYRTLFRKNENYISNTPPQNMLNKKSFLFVFLLPHAGRKVARCYCTRGRKCATVVTDTAGRREKTAKQREKIT